MAALELRERLCVRVEVPERELPLARDERAPVLPTRRERDEVAGRRELDVHPQRLLQARQLAEKRVVLGVELHVDVDGRAAPPDEDGRRSSGEVARAVLAGGTSEGSHEVAEAVGVDYRTHASARSKLTRRRTRAL